MKALFRSIRELGFDARRLGLVGQVPRFVRDLRRWRRRGGRISALYPVLTDWSEQAGSGSGAYFHQDIVVARKIFERRPRRHVDVGSRIDGFVAHVAIFRELDVLDIRPIHSRIRNVRFVQADLMKDVTMLASSTDSLSCLHALEHFGLGRYGDPVDPNGHLRGFRSLINMLEPGATLYLSFPIGRPAVEFNAHRVFDCMDVLSWPGSGLLELKEFDYIDDAGELHERIPLADIRHECAPLIHGCGIYTFVRV